MIIDKNKNEFELLIHLAGIFYSLNKIIYQFNTLDKVQKNSPSVETEGHKRLLAI